MWVLTYFVALAHTTNDIFHGDLEVIEIESTCGGGSDAQLLFLLGNLNTHVFGSYETGYASVAFARVHLSQSKHK